MIMGDAEASARLAGRYPSAARPDGPSPSSPPCFSILPLLSRDRVVLRTLCRDGI
jgi:hypothetical protein